jgi:hypothetical protein
MQLDATRKVEDKDSDPSGFRLVFLQNSILQLAFPSLAAFWKLILPFSASDLVMSLRSWLEHLSHSRSSRLHFVTPSTREPFYADLNVVPATNVPSPTHSPRESAPVASLRDP